MKLKDEVDAEGSRTWTLTMNDDEMQALYGVLAVEDQLIRECGPLDAADETALEVFKEFERFEKKIKEAKG